MLSVVAPTHYLPSICVSGAMRRCAECSRVARHAYQKSSPVVVCRTITFSSQVTPATRIFFIYSVGRTENDFGSGCVKTSMTVSRSTSYIKYLTKISSLPFSSECQAVLREDPNLPSAVGASALQPGQRSAPPHPSLPPFPYWSQDGNHRCPSPLLATPVACHQSAAITAAHRLPRLM